MSCRWEFHQEINAVSETRNSNIFRGACPQSPLEGIVTFASWSLPPSNPSKCHGLDPLMPTGPMTAKEKLYLLSSMSMDIFGKSN